MIWTTTPPYEHPEWGEMPETCWNAYYAPGPGPARDAWDELTTDARRIFVRVQFAPDMASMYAAKDDLYRHPQAGLIEDALGWFA